MVASVVYAGKNVGKKVDFLNRATQQKLSALRALVSHPATPEYERRSAESRIDEIEQRVRKEKFRARARGKSKKPLSMAEMAQRTSRYGIANLKRHMRTKAQSVEMVARDQWPFGWDGPKKEIEVEYAIHNDDYVMGWKCPDCGDHIERVIVYGVWIRMKQEADGFGEYLDRVRNGELNQLCNKCWERWNVK